MSQLNNFKPFTGQQFGTDTSSVRLVGRVNYRSKNGKIIGKFLLRGNKITPGQAGFERALRKACEGIYYISESDAEIVPFFGVKTANGVRKTILKEIQATGNTPIEEVRPAEFFSRLTTMKDWHSKADIKKAVLYEKIEKLLEENLRGLTVLRIGRIQVDIYVAGIDKSGHLSGIKTKAVET